MSLSWNIDTLQTMIRFLGLLLLAFVGLVFASHQPQTSIRTSNVVDHRKVCVIDCTAYKSLATNKSICTQCQKGGRINMLFSGQKCPTLWEAQKMYPNDQVKLIDTITGYCKKELKCKCDKIDLNNAPIIVESNSNKNNN